SGILGVVRKQVAVLLQRGATAGGVDDDRVEVQAREGIDVSTGKRPRRLAIAGVHLQCAAAPLRLRAVHHAAVIRQHTHGGSVGVTEELRHDAALDEADTVAHSADCRSDGWGCPTADAALSRTEHGLHLLQTLWKKPQHAGHSKELLQAQALVEPQPEAEHIEQPWSSEHRAENGPTDGLFGRRNRRGHRAGSLDNGAVLHTRWARRLARPTVQAGVDMLPEIGIVGRDSTLVYLANLIDAPARRISLVAEHTVGRTIVQTQPTMDALFEQLLVEDLLQRDFRCRQRTALGSTWPWDPVCL